MPYCGRCKQPCEVVWQHEDIGIGPYEHFGTRGVDIQIQHIPESDCCHAIVYYDEECTQEYDDLFKEED